MFKSFKVISVADFGVLDSFIQPIRFTSKDRHTSFKWNSWDDWLKLGHKCSKIGAPKNYRYKGNSLIHLSKIKTKSTDHNSWWSSSDLQRCINLNSAEEEAKILIYFSDFSILSRGIFFKYLERDFLTKEITFSSHSSVHMMSSNNMKLCNSSHASSLSGFSVTSNKWRLSTNTSFVLSTIEHSSKVCPEWRISSLKYNSCSTTRILILLAMISWTNATVSVQYAQTKNR